MKANLWPRFVRERRGGRARFSSGAQGTLYPGGAAWPCVVAAAKCAPWRRRQGSVHLQRGQALVLGMALAGLAAIALLRYFSVGQVVAAKARQLHALDAAAYSGALVQARALNMLSYLNRAQTGHQVAMAHLVTLGSWASLGGHEARQLAAGNPPGYLIAMLFGPNHGAAYAAARTAVGFESLAATHGQLAEAYATHNRITHHVFGAVQDEIVSTLPEARLQAVLAVLQHNYPSDTHFDITVGDDNWQGYVQQYQAQQRLRPFIQDAVQMYEFLHARNSTQSNPWVVDARCPWMRHELRRRGSTTFDASGRWQSIDTESFHALRANHWIGCYYREYAMGWGWIPPDGRSGMDVPHVDNPPANFSAQDFWRWVQEATQWDIVSGDANPLANSRAIAARPNWAGQGLPSYIDLAVAPDTVPPLQFSLKLRHPGPEGLTITTHSAAASFFQRPEGRADQRRELPNLFNPYWQARLGPSPSEPWVSELQP